MQQQLYKFDIKSGDLKSLVMVIIFFAILSLLMSALFIHHDNYITAGFFIIISVILAATTTYKKISIYCSRNNTVTSSKMYCNKVLLKDTINLNSDSQLSIFNENVRSGNSPGGNIGNNKDSSTRMRNNFLTLTIRGTSERGQEKELQLFSDHRPENQKNLLERAAKISKILDIPLSHTAERKYK